MPRLDFREIASPTVPSSDVDQWEKFARVFFESAIGGTITVEPTRGADGGIDLRVAVQEHGKRVVKLVSCKHNAHSGSSVGVSDEQDIDDRMKGWGCDVFVGFYTTIASSGLRDKLMRLRDQRDIKFEFYNNEIIESRLLASYEGFTLAKRFFPESVQNLWPKVIALAPAYSLKDASLYGDRWIVEAAFTNKDRIWAYKAEDAVRLANEIATSSMHDTLFLAAWKDAVTSFPDFFIVPREGVESASSVEQLPPNWAADANDLSPMSRWFVLGVWSFANAGMVRGVLKAMHRDASQQDTEVLSLAQLARCTSTELRDILVRLVAYCPM